jgi:hypothetical protein
MPAATLTGRKYLNARPHRHSARKQLSAWSGALRHFGHSEHSAVPERTSFVLTDFQAKKVCEAAASRRGQPQGSGVAFAFEPPEFQTAATNLCPNVPAR